MAEGGGILWHTSLPRLGNRQLPGNSCTQHCLPDSELSVQIEPVYLDYLQSPITDWSVPSLGLRWDRRNWVSSKVRGIHGPEKKKIETRGPKRR